MTMTLLTRHCIVILEGGGDKVGGVVREVKRRISTEFCVR
jgi:hypothetical protein